MTVAERVLALTNQGLDFPTIAAVLNITAAQVEEVWLDPTTEISEPGGGGAPDDWRSVYVFAATQPVLSNEAAAELAPELGITVAPTYTRVKFDTGDDPAPHGSAIQWSIDTPHLVTITETGRYDISAKHVLERTDENLEDDGSHRVQGQLLHDDESEGPFYSYDHFNEEVPAQQAFFIDYVIPGVPLKAGDTLELGARGSETVQTVEAALTISRIA